MASFRKAPVGWMTKETHLLNTDHSLKPRVRVGPGNSKLVCLSTLVVSTNQKGLCKSQRKKPPTSLGPYLHSAALWACMGWQGPCRGSSTMYSSYFFLIFVLASYSHSRWFSRPRDHEASNPALSFISWTLIQVLLHPSWIKSFVRDRYWVK